MEPTNYQNPTEFNIPPKNWLVESILVTVLCCLPFGIAGIINASKVEVLFLSGDIAGANKAAADAKKMDNVWSIHWINCYCSICSIICSIYITCYKWNGILKQLLNGL